MKHWREECAVFGIWGDSQAAEFSYLGLYAQQHRGQESAGISASDGKKLHTHKGMGLVTGVFDDTKLGHLKGSAAIGHVRYSTTGASHLSNAQPLVFKTKEDIALAHNGNVINTEGLKKELKKYTIHKKSSSDTECFGRLIKSNSSDTPDLIENLKVSLPRLEGAFSLVLLTHDKLVAARDVHGFRPLLLGEKTTEDGRTAYVLASESCAFDVVGATIVREIAPGEIFWVDEQGCHSTSFAEPAPQLARCVFEFIYFARPDSSVFGQNVYHARKRMGEILAKQHPIDGDIVIPVPDSGIPAALGYSAASGIPFDFGIIRNQYVGRTFIQPSQAVRDVGVKMKLNPQKDLLKNKKVIVIDDSLVRGTTSRKVINMVRDAGAKEVHLCVSSPPTKSPCYYGIDTQVKAQLIASKSPVKDICKFIGADSLNYLDIKEMMKAITGTAGIPTDQGYCAACFDQKYPIPVPVDE